MIATSLLSKQRVWIRSDLDVPMHHGEIVDDTRIRAALPIMQQAIKAGAKVAILAHLGRPQTHQPTINQTLAPVAKRLQQLLNHPVHFCKNWLVKPPTLSCEYITLCENVRLLPGETTNDTTLAQQMAKHCDIFIMDAFATIHRLHASTYGLAQYAPKAYLGPAVLHEIAALNHVLKQPRQGTMAVIGGAKMATKIPLLEALITKVDTILVGGGIANTLLKAQGHAIGASLYEPELLELAATLVQRAVAVGCQLLLPLDAKVATQCEPPTPIRTCAITHVAPHEKILDIGPLTIQQFQTILHKAQTIIWNGPMGVFEQPLFAAGTQAIGTAISQSSAYTLAGGGDTLSAIHRFHLADRLSHISTGGGAFLAYYTNPDLPLLKLFSKDDILCTN